MSGYGDRLARVEQRMRGELPGWLQELATLVSADAPGGLQVASEGCERIRHLAHKLRGRAAVLQLAELAAAAGQLEGCCASAPSAASLRRAVADCVAASPPIPAVTGLRRRQ